MPAPPQAGGAWSRYRDNLARHLIGISRDLQCRAIRRLSEEHGYRRLRPSLGPFLSLVWTEGRRLNAIADQLAISRQACSQLANVAERAGYLERKPDPEDRRAKVVMLSSRGRALVDHAVQIILECESEYAGLAGPAAYRRFVVSLAAIFEGLGIPTHADPALSAAASRSIGVLPLIAVRIQQDLKEAITARGHRGLKISHGPVLALIGLEGARIHEIARIQRVTRQAISAISQDLEALGYLRRDSDPRDRRGVVLQRTDRCTRLVRDSAVALGGLERCFLGILGAGRLEHLKRVARDLYHALHPDEERIRAAGERQAAPADEGRRRGRRAGRTDIRALAASLRQRLDHREAAHLAALLERGA
jgi:DNA-binding MarR family transcriptional regulator